MQCAYTGSMHLSAGIIDQLVSIMFFCFFFVCEILGFAWYTRDVSPGVIVVPLDNNG